MRNATGAVITVILLTGVLNACAGTRRLYDGPKRPESEVSRLNIARNCTLISLDGEESWQGTPVRKLGRKLELLPGSYNICMSWTERVELSRVRTGANETTVRFADVVCDDCRGILVKPGTSYVLENFRSKATSGYSVKCGGISFDREHSIVDSLFREAIRQSDSTHSR